MDNSCKRRAYCSYVIVNTECGQWQAPLTAKKSACLAEVSVMDRLYGNFQNFQKSWGNWPCANNVYQALFSPPTHKSLGTRLYSYLIYGINIHIISATCWRTASTVYQYMLILHDHWFACISCCREELNTDPYAEHVPTPCLFTNT